MCSPNRSRASRGILPDLLHFPHEALKKLTRCPLDRPVKMLSFTQTGCRCEPGIQLWRGWLVWPGGGGVGMGLRRWPTSPPLPMTASPPCLALLYLGGDRGAPRPVWGQSTEIAAWEALCGDEGQCQGPGQ